MKKKLILLQLILLPFYFTGCELGSIFGPSQKEIELKQKELALKEQELKFNQLLKQKELEQNQIIQTQEMNAKIEKDKALLASNKEIELEKIKAAFEKEKLVVLNKEKDLKHSISKQENDLKFSLAQQEKGNDLEIKKYVVIFATLLLIIITISLFIYFSNRRKDKLRAYEDNLNKYFREKENQTKLEIAKKVLDTIASGNLTSEQENKLISTLNNDNQTNNKILLQNNVKDKDIHDVEVVDKK